MGEGVFEITVSCMEDILNCQTWWLWTLWMMEWFCILPYWAVTHDVGSDIRFIAFNTKRSPGYLSTCNFPMCMYFCFKCFVTVFNHYSKLCMYVSLFYFEHCVSRINSWVIDIHSTHGIYSYIFMIKLHYSDI